jgi:hypothetical protein
MAITNGYCTLAEAKSVLRITDNTDDAILEREIESASRRVDGYCGRFFYQKQATINCYPYNEYLLVFPADLATSTVTIKIDTNADGTYATTLVQGTDYILQPTDTMLQGRPYNNARMVGGQTFPLEVEPSFPTCQIAGTFGWPSIPNDIREATILLTIRQFARLNAALGVVGFADMAINVRAVDPDVRDLLQPYVLYGVA